MKKPASPRALRHRLSATFAVAALFTGFSAQAADKALNTDATGPARNFSDPIWTSGVMAGTTGGTSPVVSGDALYFNTSGATSLTNDLLTATYLGFTFNPGASAYTFGGNAFTLGGNIVNNSVATQIFNNAITFDATRTVQANTGTVNLNGMVSGGFGLTKTGTGILNLTVANTYTGVTTVSAGGGTLRVTNNAGLGTANAASGQGTVVAAGGALQLAGNITITGEALSITSTSSNGTAANITSGLINESGNNEWTGPITLVANGSNNARFRTDAGNIVISGSVTGQAGLGALVLQGTSTGTISGVISGGQSLINVGNSPANTWTLSGANTYTGFTSFQTAGGTLVASSLGSFATNAALGTVATTSSSLGAPNTAANNVINFGNNTGNVAGTLRYVGSGEITDRQIQLTGTGTGIGGTGTIDQSGTGLLKFVANVVNTNATGAKTLALTGTGAGEISGNILTGAGTTSVTKSGAGTWTLSGTNTYTGATTLNAGNLNFGSAGALNGGGAFVIGGNGTFDNTSGAALTYSNALNLSGGSPTFAGTNEMTFNGLTTLSVANRTITVSASTLTLGGGVAQDATPRSLTKLGLGTLVLNSASTYTGATIVSGGTLSIAAGGSIGSGATGTAVAINSGTLINNGTITGTTTVASGGTLRGNGTFNGAVANAGTHIVGNSPGRQFVTIGGYSISAGTVQFDTQGITNNVFTINPLTSRDPAAIVTAAGTFFAGDTGGPNGFNTGGPTAGYDPAATAVPGEFNHASMEVNGGFARTGTGTLVMNYFGTYTKSNVRLGDVFDLLDVTGGATTGFAEGRFFTGNGDEAASGFDLLDLSGTGLFFDTTLFDDFGILVVVPEPSRALLLLLAGGAMLMGRRRRER